MNIANKAAVLYMAALSLVPAQASASDPINCKEYGPLVLRDNSVSGRFLQNGKYCVHYLAKQLKGDKLNDIEFFVYLPEGFELTKMSGVGRIIKTETAKNHEHPLDDVDKMLVLAVSSRIMMDAEKARLKNAHKIRE